MANTRLSVLAAALLTAMPAPALAGAGAGSFTLVNQTGAGLSDVTIRRFGTEAWQPLGAAPSPGGRAPVQFDNPDCAFDIRANVGGTPVVWSGVNLCEVNAVILKRSASGAAWVEYE